jgi:hypothetical protein
VMLDYRLACQKIKHKLQIAPFFGISCSENTNEAVVVSALLIIVVEPSDCTMLSTPKEIHQIRDIQGGLRLHLMVLRDKPISTETEIIPEPGSGACARRPRPVSRPSCLSVNREHRQIGKGNTRM